MRRGTCLSTHSIMSLFCNTGAGAEEDEEEDVAAAGRGAALGRLAPGPGPGIGPGAAAATAAAGGGGRVACCSETRSKNCCSERMRTFFSTAVRCLLPSLAGRPSAENHGRSGRQGGHIYYGSSEEAALTFQQPAAHQIAGLSAHAGRHLAAQTQNMLLQAAAIQRALHRARHGDLQARQRKVRGSGGGGSCGRGGGGPRRGGLVRPRASLCHGHNSCLGGRARGHGFRRRCGRLAEESLRTGDRLRPGQAGPGAIMKGIVRK